MTESSFALPKVLLMGLRKSGKSSIQKILFEGMQPHESVNLPTTLNPSMTTVHSNDFIIFEVWDFPGQNDPFEKSTRNLNDVSKLLKNYGGIVFVLDCSEFIDDARARLLNTIESVYKINRKFYIEVFIHKVDKLNDSQKGDLYTTLKRKVEEEVKQRLDDPKELLVNFNLTSIYDHSVFEAFSIVVQRLVGTKVEYITSTLEQLNTNSNFMLSYLFLSKSKIYIAMDERIPNINRYYDLCSDAIEMVVRIGGVYTTVAENDENTNKELVNKTNVNNNYDNVVVNENSIDKNNDHNNNNNNNNNNNARSALEEDSGRKLKNTRQNRDYYAEEVEPSSTTIIDGNNHVKSICTDVSSINDTGAVICLNKTNCIYMKELPNSLTLITMMECANLQNKLLIDRNIDIFYNTIFEIFNTELE